MSARGIRFSVLVAAVALSCAAVTTAAAVDLRFAPADTTVAPGTAGYLSIVLDEAVTVHTLEVFVTYDSTLVAPAGGVSGALFTTSGYQLFDGYEDLEPGRWHGYVVIMGAGLFVTGPGELFRWDFTGEVNGVTDVVAVEVHLVDVNNDPYGDLVLPPTTVRIGDGTSSTGAPPLPPAAPRLTPNPFNPRTEFSLDLPTAGPVRLDVLDVRGRMIAVLFDGQSAGGSLRASWDGRDDGGQAAPGGVYLFRCRFDGGISTAKGLLLK